MGAVGRADDDVPHARRIEGGPRGRVHAQRAAYPTAQLDMAEAGAPRRRARPASAGRGQCDQPGGGLGEMFSNWPWKRSRR